MDKNVEISCEVKNTRRGISNIVRRNINFLSMILRITQAPTINVVSAYVKTILLNSKTSEVKGHKTIGTKKIKNAKI